MSGPLSKWTVLVKGYSLSGGYKDWRGRWDGHLTAGPGGAVAEAPDRAWVEGPDRARGDCPRTGPVLVAAPDGALAEAQDWAQGEAPPTCAATGPTSPTSSRWIPGSWWIPDAPNEVLVVSRGGP